MNLCLFKCRLLLFSLLVVSLGFATRADEINSLKGQVNDENLTVEVTADAPLAFKEKIDYAEWKMYFTFPGFSLALPSAELTQKFPEQYRDFVDSFFLERTPSGSQLVLVLGKNAVPLKVASSTEDNAFIVRVPTADGTGKEDEILVQLGFLDPPVSFLEVSPVGKAYRVVPILAKSPVTVGSEPASKRVEISAELPPIAPTGIESFLIPASVAEKGSEEISQVSGPTARNKPSKTFRRDFRIAEERDRGREYSFEDFSLRSASEVREKQMEGEESVGTPEGTQETVILPPEETEEKASEKERSWEIKEEQESRDTGYTFESFILKKETTALAKDEEKAEAVEKVVEEVEAVEEAEGSEVQEEKAEVAKESAEPLVEAEIEEVEPAPPILQVLPEDELKKVEEPVAKEVVVSETELGVKVEEPAGAESDGSDNLLEVPESELFAVKPSEDTSKPRWIPESQWRKKKVEEGQVKPPPPPPSERPWDVRKERGRLPRIYEPPLTPEQALLKSERVTYEATEATLAEAIALLVAGTPFNVIVDDTVGSLKITVSFRDTPLLEALDTITAAKDIMYRLVGNTIIVGGREDIGRRLGGYETRTFTLQYADAEDVKKVITENGLTGEKNVSIYYGEKRTVDYSDRSTFLSEGEEGISAGDVRKLTGFQSTAKANVLVVTETPDRLERIARVVAEIDRKPRVVTLETTIVEINEEGLKQLGLKMEDSISQRVVEEQALNAPSETETHWVEASSPGFIALGLWFQDFFRSPLDVLFELRTVLQSGNARILSRPNLSAVDGSQAIYFAGTLIPYIRRPAVVTPTAFTPPQVEFQAVGVTLNFKPRIDDNGVITMDVNPVVSTLLELVDLGGGAVAPRTQTRQVMTTIQIPDGETFVIAGMLSETERESLRKIPILGELPLFGKLFSRRDRSTERTEVMVFVTPRIREE